MDPTGSQGYSDQNTPNGQDLPNRPASQASDNHLEHAGFVEGQASPTINATRTPSPLDVDAVYSALPPGLADQLVMYHQYMNRIIEIAELAYNTIERLEGEYRRLASVNNDIAHFMAALQASGEGSVNDSGGNGNGHGGSEEGGDGSGEGGGAVV
ncbi:hypothetical protein EYR41_000264 [Orbilia oligospora]|uniref:Uncharacterized protein n=1 Tax=Orbilia oligospora TaxID=2813651 RepID=A0A7C8TRZ1_ORBOL|nr:hypothetical protein TWF751_001416 [Orbilia oligospora]TGJ73150.1 hypothetical protein EYR41_000264 [Orbilia oligospora]